MKTQPSSPKLHFWQIELLDFTRENFVLSRMMLEARGMPEVAAAARVLEERTRELINAVLDRVPAVELRARFDAAAAALEGLETSREGGVADLPLEGSDAQVVDSLVKETLFYLNRRAGEGEEGGRDLRIRLSALRRMVALGTPPSALQVKQALRGVRVFLARQALPKDG